MYALIPDIEAPAKKNIEDDGNLDSALWNRVTGKINDIKLKALAEEEKVQKVIVERRRLVGLHLELLLRSTRPLCCR